MKPPTSASETASPTNNPKMLLRVKPSVFNTATSRVRSRIDIAMVFADTSRMVKTTARQMLMMNALMLPNIPMKPNWKACSLSVFGGTVGVTELLRQ